MPRVTIFSHSMIEGDDWGVGSVEFKLDGVYTCTLKPLRNVSIFLKFIWLPPAAADPMLDLYMVSSHDLLNHFGFILSPLCVRDQRARRIETERTR